MLFKKKSKKNKEEKKQEKVEEKKQKQEKGKEKKEPVKKVPEKKEEKTKKQEKKETTTKVKAGKRIDASALVEPIITEKATYLQSQNCYVFGVKPKANKIMVKRAVEGLYQVKPIKVNMIKVKGKNVRYGRTEGRTKDYKKAIVFLKEGDKIDFTTNK